MPQKHEIRRRLPNDEGLRFISRGSSSFALSDTPATRDYHFVLLPQMTMLAFSAAVEPLRIANQLTGQCLYRWFLLSQDCQPVNCSNEVTIAVDGPLRETNPGDTILICSGVDGYLAASAHTVAWVRDQARHGRSVGGLCTGAFTLARAGVLRGRRFTLHWENQPAFAEIFPDMPFTDHLYCRDGPVLTCGGGNAAADLVLSLIEDDHGARLAMKVSEMCLHGLPRNANRSQRMSIAAEIEVRHPTLTSIVHELRTNFADDLSLDGLAFKHGLSRRQMERLFQRHLSSSPAKKLRDIRVEHAHILLSETNLPLIEIAVACGFNSQTLLRRAYRDRFGKKLPAGCRSTP